MQTAPVYSSVTPTATIGVTLGTPKPNRWAAGSVQGAATILPGKASLTAAIASNAIITILVPPGTNPKGGNSALAFAKYSNGQTVAQFCALVKGGMGHIAWDFNHGFITLTPAN